MEKSKFWNSTLQIYPGSSFEQMLMAWSPRCCIQRFVEIGRMVLAKKTFEVFLTYKGMAAILVNLGHVTDIMSTYFNFLVRKS